MNILIVTPFYKHDRNIASVRWTNIGIRLAKNHNVIVVTQPRDDMNMDTTINRDEDGILVARINQKTWYEKIAVKRFGGATGDDWQTAAGTGESKPANDNFKRKLKNRLLYTSMKSKAKQYAGFIEKNVIPKDTAIDIVISSACPFIEMLFGYELKKCLGCKWISDFRDLPFQEDDCDRTHIEKRIMKKSLKEADAVITIANKGKEKLADGIVDNPDKIYVIRNGFSLSDARETTTIDDDKLHIVHTGSLYGGTRKADLFFSATAKAKIQNPDFKYVLECAGGNNESLVETAKRYGEADNVDNRGFVSREEALDMQSKADILLALISKTPGSFSAKIFEYILNKKPIVCVSCGSDSVGEETLFINTVNLGIAVDESNNEKDSQLLCDYLLHQFCNKRNGIPLDYNPDHEMIDKNNIDVICDQIQQVIMKIYFGR